MTTSTATNASKNLPPMDLKPMTADEIHSGPLNVARILTKWFSCAEPRPAPPPTSTPTKTAHVRLITIAASHFCEKARWGLDLLETAEESTALSHYYYTEDGHPPAFVSFQTIPASNNTSSRSPMVVYEDGTFVVGSDAILHKHCPFLYPTVIQSRIHSMEQDLGVRLGAPIRCYAYYLLLQPQYQATMAHVSCRNTSRIETIVFGAMLNKGIDKAMKQLLHINDETARESVTSIRQVFAEISEQLERHKGGGGEYYLMDDDSATTFQSYGFTAADLTFAALASPLIRPPCMNESWGVDDSQLPPEWIALRQELLPTPAGQHVLNVYAKHRPTAINGQVIIKSGRRNRWPF